MAASIPAVHRLETRVRRYKGRIKSHSSAAAAARRKVGVETPDHIVSLSDDDQPEPDEANPLIIAEGQRNISHMTVSEAVLQLDLSEASFMIFRNAAHGGLNVVYRRNDGAHRVDRCRPAGGGEAKRGFSAKTRGLRAVYLFCIIAVWTSPDIWCGRPQ